MDEATLLAHIANRSRDLAGTPVPGGAIELGPGDDTAVVRMDAAGRVCVGVDHLISGRHFEPELLDDPDSLRLVAHKAVARSVSDLAATGARPAWSLATAALPSGARYADALFDAMHAAAVELGCPLVGGDVARVPGGSPLVLTVTASGVIDRGSTPLTRSGAKAGDELWLTGPIGGAHPSGRHLRFTPRVEAGLAAARDGSGVHAAIDVSDGLGRDAARVGAASGVLLELEADAIPLHADAGGPLDAVAAGEDYELLVAREPGRGPSLDGARPLIGPIGRCRAPVQDECAGAALRMPDGSRVDATSLGWDHGG